MAYIYLSKYLPTKELVALRYTDLSLVPDYEYLDEVFVILLKFGYCRNICRVQRHVDTPTSCRFTRRLWRMNACGLSYTQCMPVNQMLQFYIGSCRTLIDEHFLTGFPGSVVAVILKEVLRGVAYLHDQEIIHGNIRANNILMKNFILKFERDYVKQEYHIQFII